MLEPVLPNDCECSEVFFVCFVFYFVFLLTAALMSKQQEFKVFYFLLVLFEAYGDDLGNFSQRDSLKERHFASSDTCMILDNP